MAFAQLTYRESLRDIEVCLSAQLSKLYHMGFHEPVRRSTLADANETRDWRIYAEFAHRLIAQARKLYADDSLGLVLNNTVYALDSTTIDLCLSLFPWAHFRSTKAAVKMHTLLDFPVAHNVNFGLSIRTMGCFTWFDLSLGVICRSCSFANLRKITHRCSNAMRRAQSDAWPFDPTAFSRLCWRLRSCSRSSTTGDAAE